MLTNSHLIHSRENAIASFNQFSSASRILIFFKTHFSCIFLPVWFSCINLVLHHHQVCKGKVTLLNKDENPFTNIFINKSFCELLEIKYMYNCMQDVIITFLTTDDIQLNKIDAEDPEVRST